MQSIQSGHTQIGRVPGPTDRWGACSVLVVVTQSTAHSCTLKRNEFWQSEYVHEQLHRRLQLAVDIVVPVALHSRPRCGFAFYLEVAPSDKQNAIRYTGKGEREMAAERRNDYTPWFCDDTPTVHMERLPRLYTRHEDERVLGRTKWTRSSAGECDFVVRAHPVKTILFFFFLSFGDV